MANHAQDFFDADCVSPSIVRKSKRRARPAPAPGADNDVVRLWMLRILVRLGGLKNAGSRFGLVDDAIARHLGLAHLVDGEFAFDEHAAQRELHASLERMERDAQAFELPEDLSRNLQRLGDALGFTEVDRRLLGFAILLHSERMLDDVADTLGQLSGSRVRQHLAELLDLPREAVASALGPQSRLATTGMLTVGRRNAAPLRMQLGLWSDGFADQMLSFAADPLTLLRVAFFPARPGHLSVGDFEHLKASLDLLRPYLRKSLEASRRGVNILIHGAPGTGKTQLAKALAAELGAELFEVSSDDEDGDPMPGVRRLFAYRAAQQVLGTRRTLLLFDEVEDVLGTGGNPFAEPVSRGRKAWINKALETNAVPTLWLSNSVGDIDPAFVRRFDMVIEMPNPPAAKRAEILRQAAGSLLQQPALDRLAACERLAPAAVTRAASVVSFIADDLAPEHRTTAVSQLINQAMSAQGLPEIRFSGDGAPDSYSPEFSNTDVDLAALAEGVATSGEGARLCLYGPPGTGKTAWARWLARHLDRPLVCRRASELLSKYVGQSEKNISRAFVEARERKAVLLIDEVDTFIQRRERANAMWQVSLVNEMLTQMESFDGLFLVTTNLMELLDDAALRRFDLKIRFGTLTGAQTATLFERRLASLGLPAADGQTLERARRLEGVTPGDFAVVARQHRFRKLHTPAEMLDAVQFETGLRRQRQSRPIGFVQSA